MNSVTFARWCLEFAVMLPASVIAVLPVRGSIKPQHLAGGLAVIACMCPAGAYLCTKYSVRSGYIMAVNVLILSAGYILLVKEALSKKLFCLMNSVMLCELCSIYANPITAPYKLLNLTSFATTFTLLLPALVHLGMFLPVGALFWRTLRIKLPLLLNEERFVSLWRYMFLLPMAMAGLVWWMTPISPVVVITGRVRQVLLVLLVFVTATMFMFYHIFWWTTVKFTESARLQQENTFLQMEAKRYDELKEYMNTTRTLRHDFRQHILVISQLAESDQLPELREYLSQFTDTMNRNYVRRCENNAVDAVASHYDYIARTQGTKIEWKLELPEVLPMKEADYCAMLGNLLENALRAAKNLAVGKRKVNVISSMLSRYMLGLSMDNPFNGKLDFGKDGLPVSAREGHGTGLISVKNTVNRYGGTMNITAEDGKFSVDIILYCTL